MNEFEMDLLIAQQRDQIDELTKANARLRDQLSASHYFKALLNIPGVAVLPLDHYAALKDLETVVRSSKIGSAAFQDKIRAIDAAIQTREA